MKLIVNADDYGLNENTTKAIAECFARGELSNTTIVVNSDYFKTALDIAKGNGFFDRIGLHVNLVEGMPLTDNIKKYREFCSEDGSFNCNFLHSKKMRLYLPKNVRIAAEDEIRAQMERFISYGFPLKHYDSHRHACTALSLLRNSLKAAVDFGFQTTRIYINLSGNSTGGRLSFEKSVYCKLVSNMITAAGLKHTEYFGYSWDLARKHKELPSNSSVEVLCHPDYRNADKDFDMNGELMDWKTPWAETNANLAAVQGSIRKISFNDL